MSAEPWLGYDALIAELRRLQAEHRTGTLFIATADNHGGQIALRDGVIVAVRLHRRNGMDAAREIRTLRTVRFNFTRELGVSPDPGQPVSSPAVWAVLADSGSMAADDGQAGVRTILTKALTEYLGPMAAIVVRDQLRDAERAGRETLDVVEALARGVDDPAAAAAFKAQVATALAARAPRRL